jgi:hypothetical protein
MTPEATATPLALAITSPAADASLATGSEVTVSGVAPAGAAGVQVALTASGLELATAEAEVQANNMWETTLVVPASMTGRARLRVSLADGSSVEKGVILTQAAATSGPAISLTQPDEATIAVAGGVLFFSGRVQQPLENEVTIAVFYDDCQTAAAQMSFDVGQGGQWWGYVVIPETVFGPACALAYTGTLGEGNWRGVNVPINILEEDDPTARGLFIANFPEMEVVRGEPVTVYGHAFNVPNRQVQVSLVVNGVAVAQGTTTVDRFGYWEIDLTLPADVAVPAAGEFVVAATYNNGEVTQTVPFTAVAP